MTTAWICGMKKRRSQGWCWVRRWHHLTGSRDEKKVQFRITCKTGITSVCDMMKGLRIRGPPDAEPKHWKRPWCWERLKAGERGDRGWDAGTASSTRQTWVWTNSGRQWRTAKPGVLQSTGLQRIRQDVATEPPQVGWIYPGRWSDEERSDLGLTGLKRTVKMMELMMSQ